ncbi:ATP-binding protein [Mesorhizobium sp. VK25A]|uniref:ATP-binding protein n=1 Tax=Mesorhizobium vachelliae TaxID=3072309 RepID=A0ABU5ACY8_9HYPH|nr:MULTISPECIES: ATP-binding protein [unclassified Mesorhizobium]MDX8534463.1 ATP-binding protein [Mesorhizobium sp. VK25D]MDX8547285.1 ATP-binding protein [Mesorhizobium sp. VK25A]
MIDGVSFQTKARTVDHLGREQIADCPTAISELWKNAFDAYARKVELNIYDGEDPVAVISDDGHGMSRSELVGRWLVVGTESKATSDSTPIADRLGLPERTRQGQKGIGRLSCANLGPILLLVSKRINAPYVAALIDWRLFENPFLNLSDIFVPIVEFQEQSALLEQLPTLISALTENLTGGRDASRAKRLQDAWRTYDQSHLDDNRASGDRPLPPSEAILSTLSHLDFGNRHFAEWPVWSGRANHGTALLVAQINYDLRVELETDDADPAARAARDRFFETLSSFVDPFVDPANEDDQRKKPDFSYSVRAWDGSVPRLILGDQKQFDRRQLDGMEHQIVGTVGPDGTFRGRVKAFGKWLDTPCVIEPPKDLDIPQRPDTRVGPFDIYIATMEFTAVRTTHSQAEFQHFKGLAERYSGFMIFRDGLRVLPYGRTDNDFFEIESRRSKNAGREFWNHRQMFGRLSISRATNPNLKDKAGREGLLDNRAAKTLKLVVSQILEQSARRYFGSDSDIRQELLPQITESNKARRASEDRNKLRQKQRQEFRGKLRRFSQELPELVRELENYAQNLHIADESQISKAQQDLEIFRERAADFRLPGAPKSLGSLEEAYTSYRDSARAANVLVETISQELDAQIERVAPRKPRELLERQLARNAAQIHHRIKVWARTIDELQKAEFKRIRDLVGLRNKHFHSEAEPLLARFDRGELGFAETSKLMDHMKSRVDSDNADIFQPYIGALESLKESIDLEQLAVFSMEEVSDMRAELDRLNALAQLGIAVEIVGHELQAYDDIIGDGLGKLPDEVRSSRAVKDIEFGYQGLTDQLRFLSPLRLAGQKIQRWITGREIADYVGEFFRLPMAKQHIVFSATDEFLKFRVFDQQSRLLPVFINLINNSIYWLSTSQESDRKIVLCVVDDEIVVSDSGPGVDADDVASLFGLFFTRKTRGGRGVGLYLSRANLAAGGHRIRYESPTSKMPLKGANFIISFRGAEFDGE